MCFCHFLLPLFIPFAVLHFRSYRFGGLKIANDSYVSGTTNNLRKYNIKGIREVCALK